MTSLLVVFQLPDGSLASLSQEDLASLPAKGSFYILSGALYEVERTVESLGPQSGDAKLFELLALVTEDKTAALGKIQDLSSRKAAPGSVATPGIIQAPTNVLLVCLRSAGKRTGATRSKTRDLEDLHLGAIAGAGSKPREAPRTKRARKDSPRRNSR